MAGEQYIGVDEQGRPRYKTKGGRMLPPTFRPQRRRSPSSRVTDQVSERSRNVIAEAFSGLGGVINSAQEYQRPGFGRDVRRSGQAVRGIGGMVRDTSTARDEFMNQRATYGEFSQEGRYGGEWQGYRDGMDTIGDPNAPFQVRVVGDAEKILKGMDPTVLARLQDRLVAAGYMEGGKFAPGAATDEKTLNAFRGLLTQSNSRGMIWQEALADTERVIKETGIGADEANGGRQPFASSAYLAPDYAALAQTVKNQLRDSLGRDPDESEIAQLTGELEGWYREGHDEELEAARREYELQDTEEGGVVEAGVAVDPEARFKESFEKRFSAELRGIERSEEAGETQELVQGGVSALSQMSGGLG